ncbi:MAG: proline dehydrogenase [Bacteroidetes bacterium HLUCCA01]|nr:MAG: proline dehydrogenase [Bacteroidetes bacterium HLUCCA01]
MRLPFALARRFVAGEVFEEAVSAVASLNNKGIAVSLDLLGENVKDRKLADQTVDDYINLVRGIAERSLNSGISIKLTMLGLDIDYQYTIDNLHKLLEVSKEHDVFVRIDMEGSPYTRQTVSIFENALKTYGNDVGLVLQAYLKRTAEDISNLAARNADIRLCKGAYSESQDIAIRKMPEIRTAYKKYAETLLEKTKYPRFATHDDELINWVKNYTTENNVAKSAFEFQMLYGLRQDTCEQLVQEGYNVRVYVPYGTMWVPYFTRRLKERKENVFFVLSTMFKK